MIAPNNLISPLERHYDIVDADRIFMHIFTTSWTLPDKNNYLHQIAVQNDWSYWKNYNNFFQMMVEDNNYDLMKEIMELTKVKQKPTEISETTKSYFIESTSGQQALGCQEITSFIEDSYRWIVFSDSLYYFDGTYWKLATFGFFTRIMQNDFINTEKEELFSALNDGNLQSIYKNLQRKDSLQIDEKTFYDTEENYINFTNGTYDLQEQKLLPHKPEFYCKNIIDAGYEPGKNGDFFESYINSITHGNNRVRQRILECLGYCLANDMNAKVIPLILGPGNSGKSTFGNFMIALVGNKNATAVPLSKYGDSRYVTNELADRKIAIDVDAANITYNANVAHILKQLSGNDLIAAEKKYGDLYSFKNTCKVIILSNTMPRFNPYDEQLNSRWLKIPFPYPVQEKDTMMLEKLLENRNYITSKAIQAFIMLKMNNYQFTDIGEWETYEPPNSHDRNRKPKRNQCVIDFIDKCCKVTKDPKDQIPINAVFQSYSDFCNQYEYIYGEDPVPKTTFSKILRQYLGDKIKDASHSQKRSICFLKLTAD